MDDFLDHLSIFVKKPSDMYNYVDILISQQFCNIKHCVIKY